MDVESRQEMTQTRRRFKTLFVGNRDSTVMSRGDSHVSQAPAGACLGCIIGQVGMGDALGYLERALQPCEAASQNPSAPSEELLPTRNPTLLSSTPGHFHRPYSSSTASE